MIANPFSALSNRSKLENGSFGGQRIATKVSFDDERSGTNLEVWRGGGCGGERVNKRRKEAQGCLLSFKKGQIPFLWM